MSKRNYKATMVLDPKGNEGGSDEIISKLSDIIRSADGEVKKVENLGSRNLARPSKKKSPTGIYIQFEIEWEPEVPARLHKQVALEKNIDRIVVERA